VHLVGLVAVVAAALLVAVRTVRARTDDRVASLLAVGILANLGAFLISTLPFDALSARQIVSILPLGAALAGRVYGPVALRSLRVARGCVPALAAVLLGLSVAFGVQASVARPVPPANQDITDWLLAQGLTEGIGGYWSSEVIMLSTGGRLTVAPLSSAASYLPWVYAYRWESKADWFDPTRHDARFIVIDKEDPAYGSVDAALMQFGEPVQRKDFGRFAVLVYHHNLLVGLPAVCGAGHTAATMARCPRD
jgi:hypothetical protein